MNPLYVLSGFFVGTLVGLTGVGGGSLMTPILVLAFGVHPVAAVGTDLLYAAATKGGGTLVHGLRGTVAWRITGLLAAGSVPATALTLFGLSRLGVTEHEGSRVICVVLGVGLMLTAVALVFRRALQGFAAARMGVLSPRQRDVLTVLTGSILGVLVSLSSVGAGAVGVTVLILLYPELPTARIVGSDIAHAVPLTLVAGLGHWMLGSVNWSLLGWLLMGSIPGIFVGSNIAALLPERILRPMLAATLALVGTRLVIP
jgi:uncharacterized membrane protein YfcA